ncbi:MAG: hypothetical protein JNM39_05820 [Bdellovibrionaceae bacterium]|nr:hypothetical protein [Pseudobdellovibrionaceae bacterium]
MGESSAAIDLVSSLVEHMDSHLDYPKECAAKQFEVLLSKYGCHADTLTLEQLREIVGDHLQNVLIELKEDGSCAS